MQQDLREGPSTRIPPIGLSSIITAVALRQMMRLRNQRNQHARLLYELRNCGQLENSLAGVAANVRNAGRRRWSRKIAGPATSLLPPAVVCGDGGNHRGARKSRLIASVTESQTGLPHCAVPLPNGPPGAMAVVRARDLASSFRTAPIWRAGRSAGERRAGRPALSIWLQRAEIPLTRFDGEPLVVRRSPLGRGLYWPARWPLPRQGRRAAAQLSARSTPCL